MSIPSFMSPFADSSFSQRRATLYKNVFNQVSERPTVSAQIPHRATAESPSIQSSRNAKADFSSNPVLSAKKIQSIAYQFESMDQGSGQTLSRIFQAPFQSTHLPLEKNLMIQSGLSDFMEAVTFQNYLSAEESSGFAMGGLQSFFSALPDSQVLLDPLRKQQLVTSEDAQLFEETHQNLQDVFSSLSPQQSPTDSLFSAALAQQQRNYFSRAHLFPQANLHQGTLGLRALRNTFNNVKDSPLKLPTSNHPSTASLPNGSFLSDPLHAAIYQSLNHHLARTPLSLLHQPDNALYTHQLLSSLGSTLFPKNIFSFNA